MAIQQASRPRTAVESSPGVWVIGDALAGAATGTVVAAMAQGTWTAKSLINALNRPIAELARI